MIELVIPGPAYLPGYAAALRTGWSPNNGRDVSGEHLAAIERDAGGFVAELARETGGTVTLDDGRVVPRLPGRVRWIWDGAFCGAINLRFQPGTEALPAHVSGHIGYAVVPWKRRQGCATEALRLMLGVASGCGLARVLVTCDVGNEASAGVIRKVGGVHSGVAAAAEHGADKHLFWIELP